MDFVWRWRTVFPGGIRRNGSLYSGFYDRFIGSIHNVVFGKRKDKMTVLRYLVKLGVGWAVGMVLAVLILSSLFDSHIYTVSSLFIGFIAGSIPLIILEEKESFRPFVKGLPFCLAGILVVAGITWLNGRIGNAAMVWGSFLLVLESGCFSSECLRSQRCFFREFPVPPCF